MRARPAAPPLYVVADAGVLGTARLPAAVNAMAEEGVRWIQLRAKQLSGAELWRLAGACARGLAGSGVVLWVNDRADLVAVLAAGGKPEEGAQPEAGSGRVLAPGPGREGELAPAPGAPPDWRRTGGQGLRWGLHLGQDDLPPAAARPLVGPEVWIGRSTHDPAQVVGAEADPEVDVIAFGPIFPTSGKERPDPPVGLAGLRQARATTGKPLVAIGGIYAGNIAEVLAAGADCAAVLGAVCRGDVRHNCRELLAAVGAGRRCASS